MAELFTLIRTAIISKRSAPKCRQLLVLPNRRSLVQVHYVQTARQAEYEAVNAPLNYMIINLIEVPWMIIEIHSRKK